MTFSVGSEFGAGGDFENLSKGLGNQLELERLINSNIIAQEKLRIAVEALQKITNGDGICVSYDYDPNPTEREVAQMALQKISKITNHDIQRT